jgi:prepilin-type N-terminal cleavage/methylation domain-containing protein
MLKIKNFKRGFTLIELLISIAIVAIISASVGVISIQGNLKKARDNRRTTNLEAVRSALEQYRADNSGVYPDVATYAILKTTLAGYANLPDDPLSTQSYTYNRVAASRITQYNLYANMELVGNRTGTYSGINCGAGITCTYLVTQP